MWVTGPLRKLVHKKFFYIKCKRLRLNFSSIIFPRIAISNCSSEWDSICSMISSYTVSLSAVVCLPRFFGIMLFFGFQLNCIRYTASSARKSFTKVSRPLTLMAHSSLSAWLLINLSVLTRDITRFLSFLFSLCNKITTVKTVLSEVKPSGWSPCFPVKNFCTTGRYSKCSCVILSATNVKMHSRCYYKIAIF